LAYVISRKPEAQINKNKYGTMLFKRKQKMKIDPKSDKRPSFNCNIVLKVQRNFMKRKGSEAVSVWAMVKATAVHLFKSESNLSDI